MSVRAEIPPSIWSLTSNWNRQMQPYAGPMTVGVHMPYTCHAMQRALC